jgi:hypothetical protein
MGTVHMTINKRPILSGLAVLGATIGLGTGLAIATSSTTTPSRTPTAATVPQQLVDHLAVFRSGPSTEAEAAVNAMRNFAVGVNEQFGLNVALARLASNSQSVPLWVVPGGVGVCIFRADTGRGGCTSIANAMAGNLQILDGNTVYGLAPDGNPVVLVHKTDGSAEQVAVEHNVYVIEHAGAKSVDLTDGSGKGQHIEVP